MAVRDAGAARPDLPTSATLITDPDQLVEFQVDVVAEAAGRDSVEPWGRAAFAGGADLIVSSVSSFADADLLDSLRHEAARVGAQVRVQPGALAGVEALAAARLLGLESVEHRIVKPPGAWRGTPAEEVVDLAALKQSTSFAAGSATQIASDFPQNANVAMTVALAGVGPDATRVSLVADPAATRNRHELVAVGAFGELSVTVSNSPLPDNPKTSALAALSLVRAIENQATAVAI